MNLNKLGKIRWPIKGNKKEFSLFWCGHYFPQQEEASKSIKGNKKEFSLFWCGHYFPQQAEASKSNIQAR